MNDWEHWASSEDGAADRWSSYRRVAKRGIQCSTSVSFTMRQLEAFGDVERVPPRLDVDEDGYRWWGDPDIGVPCDYHMTCPGCGREDIRLLPTCTGGGHRWDEDRYFSYRLTTHFIARPVVEKQVIVRRQCGRPTVTGRACRAVVPLGQVACKDHLTSGERV